jgi:THO complex subunit 1 transcription elongation factor
MKKCTKKRRRFSLTCRRPFAMGTLSEAVLAAVLASASEGFAELDDAVAGRFSLDRREAWCGGALAAFEQVAGGDGEGEGESDAAADDARAQAQAALMKEWDAQKEYEVHNALHGAAIQSLRTLREGDGGEAGCRQAAIALFGVAIHCASAGHAASDFPFELIEVLMECVPTGGVAGVADALIHFVSYFGERKRIDVAKNRLAVLRAFAGAQRRITVAMPSGSTCAGRLSAVLGRLLPLCDKSTQGAARASGGDATLFEGVEEAERNTRPFEEEYPADGAAEGVDWQHYSKFWQFQQLLARPVSTWSEKTQRENFDAPRWAELEDAVNTVLSAIRLVSPNPPESSEDGQTSERAERLLVPSPAVFRPQLRDAAFRSTVLMQVLILCNALTESASPAEGGVDAPVVLRSVADWRRSARELMGSSCGKVGAPRLRAIEHVLGTREHGWLLWKNDNFRSFEILQHAQTVRKRLSSATDLTESATAPKRQRASTAHFARLVEAAAGTDASPFHRVESLATGQRPVPPAMEFFQQFVEDEDPDNGVEEEYFRRNDSVVSWRGRVLAQSLLVPERQSSKMTTLIANTIGSEWTEVVQKREAREKERKEREEAEKSAQIAQDSEAAVSEAGDVLGADASAALDADAEMKDEE